jgi:hypothetical protein
MEWRTPEGTDVRSLLATSGTVEPELTPQQEAWLIRQGKEPTMDAWLLAQGYQDEIVVADAAAIRARAMDDKLLRQAPKTRLALVLPEPVPITGGAA